MSELFLELAEWSLWEWLAAILGVAYVWFAAKENLLAWPSAFLSTSLYTWLFVDAMDLMAILNAFYLVMALVGFWVWKKGVKSQPAKIHRWPIFAHGGFVLLGLILSFLVSFYLPQHFDTQQPLFESIIMIFSVMTTLLVVIKVLENWLYWIVIDLLAVGLFFTAGWYPTAMMYAIYVVFAAYAFIQWKHKYEREEMI